MINKTRMPAISLETGFYQYLQKINKIPSLTQEEEITLAMAYTNGNDLNAAHKLVTSHLKLVAKIAVGYKNYGLPVSDLISEGNIGLMQAVKKFNPNLGFRLSTYAIWWIKAAIQEYVLKSWSLVKIGTTSAQKKLFFSLGKIKKKISQLYSRSVTDEDCAKIANLLGVNQTDVREMNSRLTGSDLSLNDSLHNGSDGNSELIEFVPESRPNQEFKLMHRELLAKKNILLSDALQTLNKRELYIFKERKLNDSPKTLDTLSVEYNISKERIRQIENVAFEKVKAFMLKRIQKPLLSI